MSAVQEAGRAGETGILSFAVEKNFRNLLSTANIDKVERLYQVKLAPGTKDVKGQWFGLVGETIDRLNAKAYCHAVCNPAETSVVQLSGPLYPDSVERIESHTNAVIQQLKTCGWYRVSGSKSSIALALSILEDVQSSGVFDTSAKNQLESDEPSDKSGSTGGTVISTRKRKTSNMKSDTHQKVLTEKAAGSDTVSNSRKVISTSGCKRKKRTSKTSISTDSVENQPIVIDAIQGNKKKKRKRKKNKTVANKIAVEITMGETFGKTLEDGKQLPTTSAESLPLSDNPVINTLDCDKVSIGESTKLDGMKKDSRSEKFLSNKESVSKAGLMKENHINDNRQAASSVRSTQSILPIKTNNQSVKDVPSFKEDNLISTACKPAAQTHSMQDEVFVDSCYVSDTSSKKVTKSRKNSRASKRLSMSLISILSSSNARMDNCLEAPDPVKRAIISCMENDNSKLANIDDSVILVDNDEDDNNGADVSQIVISDDDVDGYNDNNITIISLDDTLTEVNNNNCVSDSTEIIPSVKDSTSLKETTAKLDNDTRFVTTDSVTVTEATHPTKTTSVSTELVNLTKTTSAVTKSVNATGNTSAGVTNTVKATETKCAITKTTSDVTDSVNRPETTTGNTVAVVVALEVASVKTNVSSVNKTPSDGSEKAASSSKSAEEKGTVAESKGDDKEPSQKSLSKRAEKRKQLIQHRKDEMEAENRINEKLNEKKQKIIEIPARYRTPYVNRPEKKKSNSKNRSKRARQKAKHEKKSDIITLDSDESDDHSKNLKTEDRLRTPKMSSKTFSEARKREMNLSRSPISPYLTGRGSLISRRMRYIIIDGSNVAMAHGNGKVFSCRGILIAVDYFRRLGHDLITVFLPQWRKCRPDNHHLMEDQHLLNKLEREGYLVFTPSRRIGRKLVASYDDRFILELAEREDGIIVSNDNFRDLMMEKYTWRKMIEERLLMYSFVRDHFMLPMDPLGRNGPTLQKFLRH